MQTPTHKIWSRLKREEGQAFVEFVIVLPLLVMLILGICQFGLAFHNYLSITDASRVGARAAAVNRATLKGPCQAAKDAIEATVSETQWNMIEGGITCNPESPGPAGSSYTISFTYPYKIGLPDFSAAGELKASATERLE